MRSPAFSTGIGLMLAAIRPDDADGWLESTSARQAGVFDRLGGWMRSVMTPVSH